MGACISRQPDAGAPPSAAATSNAPVERPANKGAKLKTIEIDWKSDKKITKSEVLRDRQTFWETCSSYGGREDVWLSLKGASEQGDLEMAQAIIDSCGITLPNGLLSQAYDELGYSYQVPLYCLAYPSNVSEDPVENEPSTSAQTYDEPDGVKGPPPPECPNGAAMSIRVRLSTGEHNVHKWEVTSQTTVSHLKARIHHEDGITPPRQRFFFAGKQLADANTLEAAGLKNGYTIQVVVN